jgi:hypothetical protein
MSEERLPEREVLSAVLRPGKSCPPPEELARLAGEPSGALPVALSEHVKSCAYCRTEVRLLQTFLSAETREEDAEAVRLVAAQLKRRSAEVFARPEIAAATPDPWWKSWIALPWLRPAAFAMAGVLLALTVGVQWRSAGPPALRSPGDSGAEVLRSRTLVVLAPNGDLQQAPREIQWQPVPGATKYAVRLLEVDRTELWRAETSLTSVEMPPPVQARIVPAKTIVCEVAAFDAAGRRVAESESVRFRLLQKVYSR